MSDFNTKQPAPQSGKAVEFYDGDDAETPVTGFTEAPQLGSESVANFGAPQGVAPGGTRIH